MHYIYIYIKKKEVPENEYDHSIPSPIWPKKWVEMKTLNASKQKETKNDNFNNKVYHKLNNNSLHYNKIFSFLQVIYIFYSTFSS